MATERRDARRAVAALPLVAAVLAALSCSKTPYDNVCPSSGTYVLSLAPNGAPVTVPGWPPLGDPGARACTGAVEAGACAPSDLEVTVTFAGWQSQNGGSVQFNQISWSDNQGRSGSCSPLGTSGHVEIGSADGGLSDVGSCDVIGDCTGGIDSLGMRVAASGVYAGMIEASASTGGCCWQGSGRASSP